MENMELVCAFIKKWDLRDDLHKVGNVLYLPLNIEAIRRLALLNLKIERESKSKLHTTHQIG